MCVYSMYMCLKPVYVNTLDSITLSSIPQVIIVLGTVYMSYLFTCVLCMFTSVLVYTCVYIILCTCIHIPTHIRIYMYMKLNSCVIIMFIGHIM